VGARGDWVPSPATRQGVQGGRVVFADFGRGKVYAVTADGEEVYTFDSLENMIGKLCPDAVVIYSLPGKLQKTAAEIAKAGVLFLRLKNLKKISEERKSNGVKKTNENDVKLLRGLFYRYPEEFQPLSTSPEGLEVRALTELWVKIARMKKASKRTRTETNNPVAVKISKTLRNNIDELSREIHEKALRLPLYRRVVDELGLKGPSLAYIISHDATALMTLTRNKLEIRYDMVDRPWKSRSLCSQLLISLARTTVINRHQKYREIYEYYRRKGKKHWSAILRVARRMLRDLRQQAQKAGPPA